MIMDEEIMLNPNNANSNNTENVSKCNSLGNKKCITIFNRLVGMKEKIEIKKISVKESNNNNNINSSTNSNQSTTTLDADKCSLEIEMDDQANGSKKESTMKKKNPKKFIYGNYNRYYGYRNPAKEPDKRLSLLKEDWFRNKDVLDIGCNVGHVTLSIAKHFLPKTIIGVDIDRELIFIAKKNVRHYFKDCENERDNKEVSIVNGRNHDSQGAVDKIKTFKSVFFINGNYVPDDDSIMSQLSEEYDVILALSITKWIHLNFGDDGLKRSFKKMFKQLRPDGLLILEPQEWSSYRKRKKLTDAIFQNFQAIQFKPDQFVDYLTSSEVGFVVQEVLNQQNSHKGFQRPIWILRKP